MIYLKRDVTICYISSNLTHLLRLIEIALLFMSHLVRGSHAVLYFVCFDLFL